MGRVDLWWFKSVSAGWLAVLRLQFLVHSCAGGFKVVDLFLVLVVVGTTPVQIWLEMTLYSLFLQQ
jgi:hypothetical protein